MFLMSSFYKRKEYGLPAATFFSAATISGGEQDSKFIETVLFQDIASW